MSLSGDKEVAQFKKSVKMGHPNVDLIWYLDSQQCCRWNVLIAKDTIFGVIMSYLMVGTSALVGIIGKIDQHFTPSTLINAARWVLRIQMFHKSSTIQRQIGRLPFLLAQGGCYSGAEMRPLFYFAFFAGVLKTRRVHKMLKKAGPTTVNTTQGGE